MCNNVTICSINNLVSVGFVLFFHVPKDFIEYQIGTRAIIHAWDHAVSLWFTLSREDSLIAHFAPVKD